MFNTVKRAVLLCLCAAVLLTSTQLLSCSKEKSDGKLTVLCTVFPIYDWVKNITKDVENVEVSLLVENGADLHSFQPSFSDMAKIKNSDAVIYIGGESDKWVKESISDGALYVELSSLDGITLYKPSREHIAAEHSEAEHSHEHEDTFDEHIWLSVKNARAACLAICQSLCELDGDNTSAYESNTQSYVSRLDAADERLSQVCDSGASVVFADRFPFIYLFEDYNVSYYAAFEGCTTDTDAAFDTVIKLASKLDELKCGYVFVTESPTEGLAQKAIAESSAKNAQIVTLDSMQSLTAQSIADGASYIDIMEKNTSVLEEIFN